MQDLQYGRRISKVYFSSLLTRFRLNQLTSSSQPRQCQHLAQGLQGLQGLGRQKCIENRIFRHDVIWQNYIFYQLIRRIPRKYLEKTASRCQFFNVVYTSQTQRTSKRAFTCCWGLHGLIWCIAAAKRWLGELRLSSDFPSIHPHGLSKY